MRIQERLGALRSHMREQNIHAYIIPSADPHQSEYVAVHWQIRGWISGFSGSAGTVVITEHEAGLWTDFRYFLQAEKSLEGTGIDLFRMGTNGVPSYEEWIRLKLKPGKIVSFDGRTISLSEYRKLVKELNLGDIRVRSSRGIINEIWQDRPPLPKGEIRDFDTRYAGLSRDEKLARVREIMKSRGIDRHLISTLDDIAWLFNLRGQDVEYNPVFMAYALVSEEEAILCLNEESLSDELRVSLVNGGVEIKPYDSIIDHVRVLDGSLLLDPGRTSFWLAEALPKEVKVIEGPALTTRLKALKNTVEIASLRNVMVKDGAALVKFLFWFAKKVEKGKITEIRAAKKLLEFRSEQEGFRGNSFATIAGYQGHGAIVHYEATPGTDIPITGKGLFLLDSGGQYEGGTTDITRVLALGKPSAEEVNDFTKILKGHIALDRALFPAGTRGYQLDILARKPLWDDFVNYGHGTGHGVGFALNVHEGPHSISPKVIDVAIEAGMITSNEPGVYRTGKHGVRIENLILAVEKTETEFGKFLGFETLSLCPIEVDLINPDLLEEEEKGWLNDYHRKVYEKLSPGLEEEERVWLREKTKAI